MDQLHFRQDGKFKIMMVADFQEKKHPTADSVRLLNGALEKEKPDLIVFSGDQIRAYSADIIIGDVRNNVRTSIRRLLDIIEPFKIPFFVTFGNHDQQLEKADKDFQLDIYAQSGLMAGHATKNKNSAGFGGITILSSDKTKPVFGIYGFDTLGEAKGGGYIPLCQEAIDEYRSFRDKLEEENGRVIPALLFQHIPPTDLYDMIEVSDEPKKGFFQGNKNHMDHYYGLPQEMLDKGMFMGENIASPGIKTDEIPALLEKGDVLGLYFGHDHSNSFVVNYMGMDIGYTQGCGFASYGPGTNRGVRLFELDENDLSTYKTWCLTYEELFGKHVKRPVYGYFSKHFPSSVQVAIEMGKKALIPVGCAAAVAVIACSAKKHIDHS